MERRGFGNEACECVRPVSHICFRVYHRWLRHCEDQEGSYSYRNDHFNSWSTPGGFYETWLPCDGEAYSTTDYPGLFGICQYNWGRTPNSVPSHDDDFRVPNLQGQFLRGVDHKPASQAIDPDRSSRVDSDGSSFAGTGSYQNYATSLSGASIETGYNGAIPVALTLIGNSVARYVDDLADVEIVGGDKETRPINVGVHFYIKHMRSKE